MFASQLPELAVNLTGQQISNLFWEYARWIREGEFDTWHHPEEYLLLSATEFSQTLNCGVNPELLVEDFQARQTNHGRNEHRS